MRIKKFISFALLISVSTLLKAEVIITADEGVSILAVNGEELSSDSFFSQQSSVSMADGVNQIVASYTAEIPFSGDDFSLEQSKVFVITFNSSGKKINLKAPKISKKTQLEKFNENKNWLFTDTTGKSIDYKIDTLEKEGFQLVRDYEEELVDFNNSTSPAALINIAINSSNKNISENQHNYSEKNHTASTKNEKNMPADMLRFWYEQADAETRAGFLRWITNQ